MAMGQPRDFHPLPVIGYPEAYYVRHIAQADLAGDQLAHRSYKVAQYVTLALDPKKPWAEKVKCFCHALKHYCAPPPDAGPEVRAFYAKLADLVRRYAGQEVLRLAAHEHESYQVRLHAGVPRAEIEEEADAFFSNLLPHSHQCPEWFSKDIWGRVCAIRDQWI